MKDIFKIIKEFEKIEKLPYDKKRPNHEPTESYFHLAKQLAKCMMRSDNLNWYNHVGYMEMTALYLNVIGTNKGKSERSIVNENLSQSCYTNEKKSKCGIINKPLSQKCSADENELCSTKKDPNNEVACDVTNYFNVSNVFECGRNNPDVSCGRVCMATEDNEYFWDILDTLNKYQDHHGQRLSSKNLREAVCRVMDEEEEYAEEE